MINTPNPNSRFPSELVIECNKVVLIPYTHEHDEAVRRFMSCPITMKNLLFMAKRPNGWTLEEIQKRRMSRYEDQALGQRLDFIIAIKDEVLNTFKAKNIANSKHDQFETLDKHTWPQDFQIKSLQNSSYVVAGICGFNYADFSSGKTEAGIIVDKAFWNYGVGTDSLMHLMKYAFEQLKLHKVIYATDTNNMQMRGWLEKVCPGSYSYTEKDSVYFDGKFSDYCFYTIYETNWFDHVSKFLK
ncbi:hypothetical protein AYI70_g6146 [Smittium culicis]|uniref:N-acetyltransferase domain-containing protein n=1 Tax=Smittium culicis TaxID=133412 RepID=A0A1R1XR93_9FUNG|nr:hypothetical protein AYI70_g8565 [Smittium culicis]OMJ17177.1 hypothetical protein AYI70_g6146 [Smittium culicis]